MRLPVALALAVAVGILAEPALAAPPAPTTVTVPPSPATEARARFEEGVALIAAQDFESARMRFRQAYSLVPSADILWNLAVCEMRAGHPAEALERFRQYLDDPQAKADRKQQAETQYLGQLYAATAHLDVSCAFGAKLEIDGAVLGGCPFAESIDLAPGTRRLTLREGTRVDARDVDARAGRVTRVVFAQREVVPPQPRQTVEPSAPPRQGSGRSTAAWILGSAAVVAGGTGLAVLLTSPRAGAHDTAATACFIGAGSLAAAATALVLWPTPSPSTRGTLQPIVSPQLAGAYYTQAF